MTTTQTNTPLVLSAEAQDLLFLQARTANSFSEEPVTDEQLQAIYALTKFGPTAANQQPLRVLLVRSPEARERLVGHMSGNNKGKTATAPLVAVLGYDLDFHENAAKTFPHYPAIKGAFAEESARHATGRDNAFLQAGYFIVGVRAAGLAAGPMAGFDGPGIDAEFFPGGTFRTVLVVNLGQPGPEAWMDRLPRLDYDEVITTV
jgi:3-hydroxypropanoate dehydrogenase